MIDTNMKSILDNKINIITIEKVEKSIEKKQPQGNNTYV